MRLPSRVFETRAYTSSATPAGTSSAFSLTLYRNSFNMKPSAESLDEKKLVEQEGFEPSTSCMPCKRSGQMSYCPRT